MNVRIAPLFTVLLIFSSQCSHAAPSADNIFFYRASYFPGLPRFATKTLSTISTMAGGGATTHARSSSNHHAPLLNLYGLYNMHMLGQGVPNKDLATAEDTALTDLALVTGNHCFGHLSFDGKFKLSEAFFEWTQNLLAGVFINVLVPFRYLHVSDICYRDCSPTGMGYPNSMTPEWQTFLNQFDAILAKYNVSIAPTSSEGMGDASFYIGWTSNYQDTQDLDFIDATFKIGLLAPSSPTTDINLAFQLPLGYQHHLGIPITFDIALGIYDWLTFGGHASTVVFAGKHRDIRMKTDSAQSGLIILAQGTAHIVPGTQWLGAVYAQADHFFRGLSLTGAYSFAKKNRDSVTPCDTTVFNCPTIQSDERFTGWTMHTLNFGIEYEFSRQNGASGLHLGGFYDLVIGGKRIIPTGIGGGLFSIEARWSFN